MNAQNLYLYMFDGCPYCQRVTRTLDRLGVQIEQRDILAHPGHRRELVEATGRRTVPCLRIEDPSGEVRWMHESLDIAAWLERNFSPPAP